MKSEPTTELFHLALPADWILAQGQGEYRVSTRGVTLEEQGFIHLSFKHQWPATRQRFYADVTTPLLLLTIDPNGLDVRPESGNPGSELLFPHLYGPLPLTAVTHLERLDPPHA